MRDLLTGIAIVAILALTAVFAAPWFIDWRVWRPEIETRLSSALGRRIQIAGDIGLRLLPQPRLTFEKATIDAARAPMTVTAQRIDVELSLTALMSGELRITDGLIERLLVVWQDTEKSSPASELAPVFTPRVSVERLALRGGEVRMVSADGRTLMSARGDIDVEAAALAGPWKAQGRIDIQDRRYDMRWSSGALDDDGRAALKLTVQDAGLAFLSDAEGSLLVDRKAWREAPRFEGRVNASGTLAWPFGKSAGTQPWRLTANGKGDVAGFAAQEIEFEAGPAEVAIKADGEGAMRFVDGASAKLTMKARPVDVDRILAIDPGQAAPPMPIASAEEMERFLAAIPFPIALDLSADRVFARGESFGPIKTTARLESGVIQLERAEAQLPGGVKASASGRTWIDSEPALEGVFSLTSNAPAKAWAWVTGALADPVANPRFARATEASASGRVRWRPGRFAADDVAVALDGAKAVMNAQRRFATATDPGRIGLDVKADRLDLDLLPPLGAVAPVEGPDVNLSISAKEILSANLGGRSIGSLDLEARQQSGVFTLTRFNVKSEGLAFSADGTVKSGVGRFAAELTADNLRPLAAIVQRAFPGGAADAFAARAAALSPARLNGTIAPTRDAAVWEARLGGVAGGTEIDAVLDARSVATGGQPTLNIDAMRIDTRSRDAGRLLRQFGWEASSSDQPGALSLVVSNASGKPASFSLHGGLAGAKIEVSAQASAALAPSVAGKASLSADDIAPVLRVFKLSGASQPANLKANVEVGLSGVHFTGVEGEIGRKQLQKSSMQIAVGEEARATGQIEFNELSIADLSAFAFGVDASAAASGIWSSARFPTFSPWPIPFDVEVRAPRLAISSGLSLSGASLRLVSRSDGLRIESASGDIARGRVGLAATIRREGGLASVTGRLDATALDFAALGATDTTGALDLTMDFAGNGEAVSRIVANLGGAGSITMRRLSVPQLDPAAADRAAGVLSKQEGTPTFAALTSLLDQELARGPLVLASLSAPATISAGIMRIGPARAESSTAAVAGSAQFDIRTLSLDARGSIAPRKIGGEAGEGINVAFAGPLATPRRSIDAGALFGTLTQKAAAREAVRVETIEQDQRERSSFNRRLRAEREKVEAEARALREQEAAREAAREASRGGSTLVAPLPPPVLSPPQELRQPAEGQ